MVFFVMASCTEPGYLKNDKVDFMEMLDSIDSTQLCPDCNTIRTSRSRHCSVCKHCIERFDHHCPWINNCVGLKNHKTFYMYILSQTLVVVTAFVQTVYALSLFVTGHAEKDCFMSNLINNTGLENSSAFNISLMVLLLCCTGFFILPLGILVYVHTRNFIEGKTTMERYGRGGLDQDTETRVMNSGINKDYQVYRQINSRTSSYPNRQ